LLFNFAAMAVKFFEYTALCAYWTVEIEPFKFDYFINLSTNYVNIVRYRLPDCILLINVLYNCYIYLLKLIQTMQKFSYNRPTCNNPLRYKKITIAHYDNFTSQQCMSLILWLPVTFYGIFGHFFPGFKLCSNVAFSTFFATNWLWCICNNFNRSLNCLRVARVFFKIWHTTSFNGFINVSIQKVASYGMFESGKV